jgi:hypothetical protein
MNSVQQTIEARAAALAARIDALDDAASRGCRHCGGPVELGIDGALLRAPLGLSDPVPAPYAAHIICQAQALEALAAASREAEARYRLTVAGATVLCAAATVAYMADPTVAAAEAMERAYRLAEQLAEGETMPGRR